MKRRPRLDVGAAFVLGASLATLATSCARREAPSQVEPPGQEKKGGTKALETTAGIIQDLTPVREIDHYLDGFHVMKHDPSRIMEAHHYCRGLNEEIAQCVIFDGNAKSANLIGVEYIVSERLFDAKKMNSYGKTRHLWDTGHHGHPAAQPLLAPGVAPKP